MIRLLQFEDNCGDICVRCAMNRTLAACLLVVAILFVPSIGFSATFYVPDDHPTIQAALDAVAAGNTIYVSTNSGSHLAMT